MANLLFFALALGIAITGMIFRYTTKVQALAWGFAGLLMPVSCVMYPMSSLPRWLQGIAWAMPTAHSFEGMRRLVRQRIFAAAFLVGRRIQRRIFRRRDRILRLDLRGGAEPGIAGQAGVDQHNQSPAQGAAGVTPAPSEKVKNAKLREARYFALRGGARWRA